MNFFEQLIGSQAGLVCAFLMTAVAVVLAGIRLSVYGDALGDRTGLGSGLIGLVFLAAVTSLPELVVSLTSVIKNSGDVVMGADLATGNMLGSNVFNLLILALLVLVFPRKFDPGKLESPHTDSTVYGLIMLALFALAFGGHKVGVVPFIGCSWVVLPLPIAYGFIIKREHSLLGAEEEHEAPPSESLLVQLPAMRFYSVLGLLCLCIIGGGILLSILGGRMALPPEQGGFGLEASLIGTLFLAISTSLPELVISFSSVRLGFLDMSVGNVLGSNMFNLLIIFCADVAMRGRSMLAYASSRNWASVGLILLLTLLAAVLLRMRRTAHAVGIGVAMLLFYLFAMIFLM